MRERGSLLQLRLRVPLRSANYQWRFDDADINNATDARLVVPSASHADEGRYSVRVINSSGYAESNEAVLSVYSELERASSVGSHGISGRIQIPLELAGQPTSDPRVTVKEVFVSFGVPVQASQGNLTPEQVLITSSPAVSLPPYTLSFTGGGNIGQELTILFAQGLPDQHRYRISFEQFVNWDGNALDGDTDVEFRVLQGDANNNGSVTATDVSVVRARLNQTVAVSATARADVNMSGSITGPDISFVLSRIGHSAP
jgi:hypothetical protein